MDYLSIIATRSLILFPNPTSTPSPSNPNSTPKISTRRLSSPSTPTFALPRPPPIDIPLLNLLGQDTHLAYFLVQHVFALPFVRRGPTQERDAEVMVWLEIDKAKLFIRELGILVGKQRVDEKQLSELAMECGLGWHVVSPPGGADGTPGAVTPGRSSDPRSMSGRISSSSQTGSCGGQLGRIGLENGVVIA